jgi:bacillithiol system protein YtxJ
VTQTKDVSYLATAQEVDAFLARHPLAIVFKAGSCSRTDDAFSRIEGVLDRHSDVPLGIITVVEARAASDHVASLTGKRHESPQLLVFRDGELRLHRDHWQITAEALESALQAAPLRHSEAL